MPGERAPALWFIANVLHPAGIVNGRRRGRSRALPGRPRSASRRLAIFLRELGQEHKVTLMEAPALARALYKHTDIDDEIPEKLYSAVAEVLAYVYQLRAYKKGDGDYPDRPTKLKVPDEMDPLNPASQAPPKPGGPN